jgi:hypothetical protein
LTCDIFNCVDFGSRRTEGVIRRDRKLRMKFLIELEKKEQQWIGCVKRMDRTRILRRIELSCKGKGYM